MASADSPCSVSVVIPTHNRSGRIDRCARAVLEDPATTEVVVVDDGSQDDTPAVLANLSREDARVRIVTTSGGGASMARQAGLAAATGDIVLMVDDDVMLEPGTVTGHRDRHARATRGEDLVVVGYMPTFVPSPRRPGQFATRFYAEEYERHVATWERGDEVIEGLWLGNVSAPRAVWARARMDAGRFPSVSHEDRDLGLRMRELGIVGTFDRSLRGEHAHTRTLDQFLNDSYLQGVGRWHLGQIHGTVGAEDSALGRDLPGPVSAVIRVADSRVGFVILDRALRILVHLAGIGRIWALEDAGAKLLRRIELRRGVRAAAAAARDAPS
ncbi:MAG: glycosyltransferase family A protein [Acidimicrobiales bacterium]|nr:glycosyltransferase family A protein [Acidimicrobiales bacterium]